MGPAVWMIALKPSHLIFLFTEICVLAVLRHQTVIQLLWYNYYASKCSYDFTITTFRMEKASCECIAMQFFRQRESLHKISYSTVIILENTFILFLYLCQDTADYTNTPSSRSFSWVGKKPRMEEWGTGHCERAKDAYGESGSHVQRCTKLSKAKPGHFFCCFW